MEKELLLEIKNLSYNAGPLKILKNISFKVYAQTTLGILGPNGGGKSTLLGLILKQLKPSQGEICYGHHLKRSRISYVPQKYHFNQLLPLTVMDIVQQGLFSKKEGPDALSIDACLDYTGLKDKKNRPYNKLSGGEQQRVIIARSLVKNPQLLILDEPTTGLDATGQDQLYKVLKQMQKETKLSIIVVDHNLNLVIRHSDELLCLNKTSHWHNTKELVDREAIENIYHCELEHLLIHEDGNPEQEHHLCRHDHGDKHE